MTATLSRTAAPPATTSTSQQFEHLERAFEPIADCPHVQTALTLLLHTSKDGIRQRFLPHLPSAPNTADIVRIFLYQTGLIGLGETEHNLTNESVDLLRRFLAQRS